MLDIREWFDPDLVTPVEETAAAALESSQTLSLSAVGALTTSITLAASLTCSVAAAGVLTTQISPAAAVTVSINANPSLSTTITLASAETVAINATGYLVPDAAALSASQALNITASGMLNTEVIAAAAVINQTTATGDLTTAIRPTASVSAAITTAGALTTGIAPQAAASLAITTNAALTTAIPLAASSALSISATAELIEVDAFEASVTLRITAAGILEGYIRRGNIVRYTYNHTESRFPSVRIPQFIFCDGEVDLPSLNVSQGDLAYTRDSDKLWKRTIAAWIEVGLAGGAPAAATYITQTGHAELSAEQALSALATGIVKVATGTGVLSTAVAGDFPTLNQDTTGTAGNVTGIVAIANGGTGNAVSALSSKQRAITLSSGDNNNIDLGGYGYQRITGPLGAFAITGMAGGTDGRLVLLGNSSGQTMTLKHENVSSTAANRLSLVGDLVTTRAIFIYDGVGTRWNILAHFV